MKKTGYEIIGMIKDGKPPKKIKITNIIFEYNELKARYMQEKTKNNFLNLMLFLNDEFEIVEEQKVWKPKLYEEYYFIIYESCLTKGKVWYDSYTDNNSYKLDNCFKTEEQAKKALEKIKTYVKLKRYAEKYNTEKIDWNNNKKLKWSIAYCFGRLEIYSTSYIKEIGVIYFTNKKITENAIEEIGEDNIKKLFEDNEEKNLFNILKEEDIERI